MKDLSIILSINDNELEHCAQLLSESEPFVTLKFDLEACRLSLKGNVKEVYIAWKDKEFAGFVVLQYAGLLRGYIQTLCIAPGMRGQGVGSALIEFAEQLFFKQFANSFICVSSFNEGAQKLYYKLGYEKKGVLSDHLIKGADEYILRKQKMPISEFLKG